MTYKSPVSEPIAIVGSSCLFAGGVTSPSRLWDLLSRPSDLSREVPPDRFNVRSFYHHDGVYHGTTNAPKGYWLDQDPRAFDAAFFGIAPKEAEAVDPQQRLLLETVYEALEGSGYLVSDWAGKDVAVYVGAMTADFDTISQRDDLSTSPYYATGNARSILSNRISYFYDFHGPSVTIDTACSSSLVALNQAVLGLRAGDFTAACVAGVNLMLAPEQFVVEASMHMLSPTGHCRMWDSGADGYARGEGLAVLLLKPLSRALAEGDCSRIQALIRETGVSSDGRTAGITLPSPAAQAALIRATYRRSGLDPFRVADRCQYFEAHGTGTPIGDPREAEAIHSAFFCGPEEDSRMEDADCGLPGPTMLVGSAKTVIGHTEGAAGLAGVLKAILAMRHGKVPANLHLVELSPEVASFCKASLHGNMCVPTKLMPWPFVPPGQPARASVNSFGFGGTNAHAILELYEPSIHGPPDASGRHSGVCSKKHVLRDLPHIPLMLSANSPDSLRMLVARYRDFLRRSSDANSTVALRQVAWRAHTFRSALSFRLAVSARTENEAADILSTFVDGDEGDDGQIQSICRNRANRWNKTGDRSMPKLLGIFTGQGAQWPGMSRCLFSENEIYRNSIRALDAYLAACPDPPVWSLENELQRLASDGSKVYRAEIGQPLCTAVQIGLIDVLYDGLGLRFACVVGHSSGEIAAAYAAEKLTARDAILISYYRGRVMAPLYSRSTPRCRTGRMVSVGLSRIEAERFCQKQQYRGRLSMAASNCPTGTTLSGDCAAVEEAERELKPMGVFTKRLMVDIAYHSHHMAGPSDAYARALGRCSILPARFASSQSKTRTTWVSSVDPNSKPPSDDELMSSYWVRNMACPVLFHEALVQALSTSQGSFDAAVEIGPHPALKGPVNEIQTRLTAGNPESIIPYAGILNRAKRDDVSFSDFIGFLWTHLDPVPFDLKRLLGNEDGKTASEVLAFHQGNGVRQLPAYPWDHSRALYSESRISRQFQFRTQPPHELLGSRTRDDVEGHEIRWRNLLRLDKLPWLNHHSFQGQPLLPASAYCLMALEAANLLLAGRTASVIELRDLQFTSGIVLEIDGPPQENMFSLTIKESKRSLVAAQSRPMSTISAFFSVFSEEKGVQGPLRQRCKGEIHIVLGTPTENELPPRLNSQPEPEIRTVDIDSFYNMMAGLGLQYTGPFKSLVSMKRRYNFATATLKRRHAADTTSLFISPATLDACLQVCFSTYSSPNDGALWTAFLPIAMKKVSFNMAYCSARSETTPVQTEGLVVDASLTDYCSPSRDRPARIVGDICIFNDSGQMEMQVEGLSVGPLATSQLQDTYEPYLHTVMEVDPEDTFVEATNAVKQPDTTVPPDTLLAEGCARVVAFYQKKLVGGKDFEVVNDDWPSDTEENLHEMILSSPHFVTLNSIRSSIGPLATMASGVSENTSVLESAMEEGRNLHRLQRHISRLTQQLVHRYPQMALLGLTHPGICLTSYILEGTGTSFSSFVVGTSGIEGNLSCHLAKIRQSALAKIHVVPFDFEKKLDNQLKSLRVSDSPFDLVILSTPLIGRSPSISETLLDIRNLMRPGGFLMLIDTTMQDVYSLGRPTYGTGICTPPEWPDILNNCGFAHPESHNADQKLPGGYSVLVRQCGKLFKGSALHPIVQLRGGSATQDQKLLILNSGIAKISLASYICDALRPYFSITTKVVNGLDDLVALPRSHIASFTCALILADLDYNGALLPSLNENNLCCFRELLQKPNMTMLWVTEGARSTNPDSAASMGFARTIRAEMPSLTLQMLNFDNFDKSDCKKACSIVAHTFMQLMESVRWLRQKEGHTSPRTSDPLWTLEPEIYIDKLHRRLIPRILPYYPGNERANASRQVVTKEVNSLEACVRIIPSTARSVRTRSFHATENSHFSYEARLEEPARPTEDAACAVLIRVYYSSVYPLFHEKFICVGQDELSGAMVAAFSAINASFIRVPRTDTIIILGADCSGGNMPGSSTPLHAFFSVMIRILVSRMIVQHTKGHPLLLLGPDDLFVQCVSRGLTRKLCDSSRITVARCNTGGRRHKTTSAELSIHPRATAQEMSTALYSFESGTVFIDFLSPEHPVSEFIRTTLRKPFEYLEWNSIVMKGSTDHEAITKSTTPIGKDVEIFRAAVQMTLADDFRYDMTEPDTISVPDLLGLKAGADPFQTVDWRVKRTFLYVMQPLETDSKMVAATKLRHYRTYLLCGMTRDMGQSISTLLVQKGARYIVLASRNPQDMKPRWAKDLAASCGASIRVERVDVTDIFSVQRLRQCLDIDMPPVGGIVNGAMVLDDGVFACMTAKVFERVMLPKTAGSRNLETVFWDQKDLDFFILTSSFAAIGGHAGQSNYAAANMYMNCFAARRKMLGLAGSVMNLGVIHGLGFLHRERGELYSGLEREGYPPVSERDLHHMFLEAIALGRPSKSAGGGFAELVDLTSGLARFGPVQSGKTDLHWHRDPRFSHHTTDTAKLVSPPMTANDSHNTILDSLLDCKGLGADSAEAVARRLVPSFCRRLGAFLHAPQDGRIHGGVNLSEVGVDSLVAVEMRSWLWQISGQDVPVMKILSAVSIEKLCLDIACNFVAVQGGGGDSDRNSTSGL